MWPPVLLARCGRRSERALSNPLDVDLLRGVHDPLAPGPDVLTPLTFS